MKRYRAGLIAVGAVLVSSLAACGGSASSGSSQPGQAASEVFTYDTTAPVMVDGWDPATEYSDGIIAMSEMYETLTRYNSATSTVEPLLATSWTSADGGKTWTFHLRHGVYFHTGRPMTAQAAKAAILRTIKLAGGASYVWGAVKTIDTPDPYTLVFHLSYPSPLALEASADYSAYIYDTQAAGGGNALTNWLNAGHDAGTGPYTVQTWNKGQEFEVVLKAFPQVLGRLDGHALHQGGVPRRAAGHHGRAAAALRAGQLHRADQPVAVVVVQGRLRRSPWSARRPGRTCSPSSTPGGSA